MCKYWITKKILAVRTWKFFTFQSDILKLTSSIIFLLTP